MLRLGETRVKSVLIGTHLSLLAFKLAIESELTLTENVLLSRAVALARRQKCHACCLGHTWGETSRLHVCTLRSIMLTKASLKRVHIFDCFASIDGKTSFIETDIAISTSAIWMILNCSRVQSGSWSIIYSFLSKASDRIRRCRAEGFEETSVVSVYESISTCAICKVVHSEGVRLDLSRRHLPCVVTLERMSVRNAVHWALLKHYFLVYSSKQL